MEIIYMADMRVCPLCREELESILDHMQEHLRKGELAGRKIMVPQGKEWIQMGIPAMVDDDEEKS